MTAVQGDEGDEDMGLGGAVRSRLGRWEEPAMELYRRVFINLDDLSATLASMASPKRVLEIGAGDGMMANRLCRDLPDMDYVGIDIATAPGTKFTGDTHRVRFESVASSTYRTRAAEEFDLVLIVDTLHHMPGRLHRDVLRDALAMTAPGGLIAVKECAAGRSLSHLMVYSADRYISGDKDVRFMPHTQLRSLIGDGLPECDLVLEARIPPRRNNVLFVVRKRG